MSSYIHMLTAHCWNVSMYPYPHINVDKELHVCRGFKSRLGEGEKRSKTWEKWAAATESKTENLIRKNLSKKFLDGILWILIPYVSFQATLPKASVFIWKVHPVTTLVTETSCLCSSAFMASCKLLANITFLSWSLSESWYEATSDWWVCLYPLRLQHHWVSIANEWGSACQR